MKIANVFFDWLGRYHVTYASGKTKTYSGNTVPKTVLTWIEKDTLKEEKKKMVARDDGVQKGRETA